MGSDGKREDGLSAEKILIRLAMRSYFLIPNSQFTIHHLSYARILYYFAFNLFECLYDIGMVWSSQIRRDDLVSEMADDSSDCILMGDCIL